MVKQGQNSVVHISDEQNRADILTKALKKAEFERKRSYLLTTIQDIVSGGTTDHRVAVEAAVRTNQSDTVSKKRQKCSDC